MMPHRMPLVAALAATAALAVGAPAAGAEVVGPCGTSTIDGQGRTGGTATQMCAGAGPSFTGPSIGQIATVVGPTIVSPGGISIVSAGNVAVGP
jgi:hypothetical protein